MAELKDVVGALLKLVAHARVLADMFSRDVSREYEKDPLLGAFSVPRAEIREVSMQLKFAVNAVEPGKVDLHKVARERVAEHARHPAQQVFTEFIEKHPRAAELRKLVAEKKLNLPAALESAVTTAPLADQAIIEAAMRGRTQGLAKAAAAEKLALRIDVAVTRKELAEAPEFVLSQICLTAGIRNYQWVEAGEEEGQPVQHLQPE